MSTFDPETFMNQEYTQSGETEFTPIPENEYPAVIDGLKIAMRGEDNKPVVNITWLILSEELQELMGMERVVVYQTCWLDLDENGYMGFGKNQNVHLNKIRAAVGQNSDGEPWSINSLRGAGPALIRVKQKADKNDHTIIRSQVDRVAPLN